MNTKLLARARKARRTLAPPPKLSLIEWADRYRQVAARTSATPGQWRTSTQPAAYGPMAAISEPDTHTVSIMAGTQILKSEVLLCTAGYFIDQDPAAILLVQPTQTAAESFSKERFAPMVEVTPRLSRLVATPRSRDSENTITHKNFRGGTLDFVGANSPTDLSSRPKRIILCDEIDKFPLSAGTEGDPLKLAEERASTYKAIGRAKFVRTCSPTDEETSRIAREYKFSDRRRLFVDCPKCGTSQTLEWSKVVWDKGSLGQHLPETAGILCEGCGERWSESERREALAVLEFAPAFGWRQTREFTYCGRLQEPVQWDAEGRALCGDCGERAPYAGHAGFHIPKLYSLRHRLSDIVAEFVEAQHVPELMQKWTNTALAETWHQEKGTGIDASGLPARAEVYGPDDLPLAVKVVTGFCDVQDDRLEAIFIAWGVDEEAWVFLYEVIDMDPAQGRAWAELDQLILRKFHRRDGVQFRCAAFGIDTGGHHGSQVYDFCRKRRGRRIYATKGGAGKRPIWTPHPGRSKNNNPFWTIGVEAAKDAIYGRLKIAPPEDGSPTAGCIHFTIDLDADFYSQLTSERRETRLRYGQPYVVWVLPSGKRNEVLDCFVGALAVRRALPHRLEAALEYSIEGQTTRATASGLKPEVEPYQAIPRPRKSIASQLAGARR